MIRRLCALALLLLTPLAMAQAPPKLEPLPDVPPPPPGVRDISPDEPRVQIAPQEIDRVEEVRDGGRVTGYKVTPRNAPPYYLQDVTGSGSWMRRDSLDDGVRVPMWRLLNFD